MGDAEPAMSGANHAHPGATATHQATDGLGQRTLGPGRASLLRQKLHEEWLEKAHRLGRARPAIHGDPVPGRVTHVMALLDRYEVVRHVGLKDRPGDRTVGT